MITRRPSLVHDDWSASFRPPSSESPEEKETRIAHQQEAARISKEIDDAIETSRKLHEKRKKAIKVLLLGVLVVFPPLCLLILATGQAESGKSTMLRSTRVSCRVASRLVAHSFLDFQLAFCPNYFLREIPIWKIIIQLNLIGYATFLSCASLFCMPFSSVKKLLAIIEEELDRSPAPPSPSFRYPSLDLSSDPPLTQAQSALRLRLLPLLSVETNLARQLLPEFGGASPPLHSASGWTKWASGAGDHPANGFLFGNGELCVRAGGAWKTILQRITGSHDPPVRTTRRHPSDPTPLLEALAPDIHALWTDPAVRALLKRKDVHMEHSAGFFLNDVLRIGKPGWHPGIGTYVSLLFFFIHPSSPLPDDIVRARLRTFGVEEHCFTSDHGTFYPPSRPRHPHLAPQARNGTFTTSVAAVDRGINGCPTLTTVRLSTRPLFCLTVVSSSSDHLSCPIGVQSNAERGSKDQPPGASPRLCARCCSHTLQEDSISLWKEVCASSLLARANIVLFLNKMDILESTLKAGVRVQTYVPTYGAHPNDLEHVVKCTSVTLVSTPLAHTMSDFRDKFRAYHVRCTSRISYTS